jgi:hypothetical protein
MTAPGRIWAEDLSYLGNCPAGFKDLADVILVVENQSFPAHSQYLASHSRLLYNLLADCPPFSRLQPLIIRRELEGYKLADVQTFLRHSYKDTTVGSDKEAWQLLQIADQFDSPSLMEKAVGFLETAQGDSFLQADCGPKGALHWLQMAERFGLTKFSQRCTKFVAEHFEVLQHDSRFSELPAAACLSIMKELQRYYCIKFNDRQLT